jgi:hypothetical protein
MATTAYDRYFEKKQQQEEQLKGAFEEAKKELVKEIAAAKEVVDALEKKHIELTGVDLKGKAPRRKRAIGVRVSAGPKADVGDERELESLLKGADDHRLNRKGFLAEGYNLPSAVAIAKKNPQRFGYQQNRSQGEVWLIK